ncbi:MAG: sigma-70 family RNA polymerase sigma factor [Elusimicrobia bacterium]|nr:sigma-70 family RNA polymerase sigma factor [Elusimicrobiota bacterium]
MDAQIDKLIELHADRAFAIAMKMCGNRADAGDIVQESFLRVIKYMKSYDPTYPFESWLGQIIRNVYLNSLRLEARRRSVPLSGSARDDDEAVSLEEVLADPAPGPERIAAAQSDSERVQQALATLSPTLRMPIILVDLEGMEREECARVLGCSLSALDVRLHRARASLREKLQDLQGGRS